MLSIVGVKQTLDGYSDVGIGKSSCLYFLNAVFHRFHLVDHLLPRLRLIATYSQEDAARHVLDSIGVCNFSAVLAVLTLRFPLTRVWLHEVRLHHIRHYFFVYLLNRFSVHKDLREFSIIYSSV